MSDLSYIAKAFTDNPGGLVPVLAYACVITFLIALVHDSLERRRRTSPQSVPISEDFPREKRSDGRYQGS